MTVNSSPLANQVAVVTGAGRGIGQAIAQRLAGGGRAGRRRQPHGRECQTHRR